MELSKIIEMVEDILTDAEWIDDENQEACRENKIDSDLLRCNDDVIDGLKTLKQKLEFAEWEQSIEKYNQTPTKDAQLHSKTR